MTTTPSRELELSLLKRAEKLFTSPNNTAISAGEDGTSAAKLTCVAGIDEVGRGAIAGPLAVGVAVIDGTEGAPPVGLTDSKQLTARRREAMFDELAAWPAAWAVGTATPAEIDCEGLTPALRLAAFRALNVIETIGFSPRLLLLDGSFDYLTAPADVFSLTQSSLPEWVPDASSGQENSREVTTLIKGDGKSVVIAAASVLAKVTRDRLMSGLPDPGYGWAKNKGYASAQHMQAISRLGLDSLHRLSWHLQGVPETDFTRAWGMRRARGTQAPTVFSSLRG
ncbi:ribonuclease HII [Varibaculum vaginae]|uniref:ribonuclease HII n=1 Tax=Varibaculum vaginae TaxID=2364797 RepID=UPI000F07522B|nr:ribonuclease HII [Varibaculum vaginae]